MNFLCLSELLQSFTYFRCIFMKLSLIYNSIFLIKDKITDLFQIGNWSGIWNLVQFGTSQNKRVTNTQDTNPLNTQDSALLKNREFKTLM